MIKLQRITGMRPDEVCSMRTGEIDRSKPLWTYTPGSHKTAHHGHTRTIFLGQRCQEIVTPFLKLDPGAFIFSAIEAETERLVARHAQRKTPLNQGNVPGSNRKQRARRSKGSRYNVASYRRAIQRACEDAFAPPEHLQPRVWTDDKGRARRETRKALLARLTPEQRADLAAWRRGHQWHPHQLRHNAATEWRQRYGAETTLVLLGDRSTRMVDIYAEKNVEAARKIMAEVG